MIPFNQPYKTGQEQKYIEQALSSNHLCGNGPFTNLSQLCLSEQLNGAKVLLTHSCTAALEMTALLAEISPGDEVILPSFTFVSTANAFVLRGAVPVFVDIRADTLNLDEALLRGAITSRTKAIVPVHYAGVPCEMHEIRRVAQEFGLDVIEDAAQALCSTYDGQPAGSLGSLATFSFHETKNISCGEGGALVVNDHKLWERAEVLWEKGTNRSQFFLGKVDKYTWIDLGSSFLPSELNAAYLYAQLQAKKNITERRLNIWNKYHAALEELEQAGCIRRPVVPDNVIHNAHIYYILLNTYEQRNSLMSFLLEQGVSTVFHYIPLHSAPAGKKFGRAGSELAITDNVSRTLLRLPLWLDNNANDMDYVDRVVNSIRSFFHRAAAA